MFERFTESARRTLFFARLEVTELGGTGIGSEHLLLGLLRNGRDFTSTTLERAGIAYADVRREAGARSAGLAKIGSSVETPFDERAKRVLQLTAEESDRLQHSYIGTEHVLLALVRDAEAAGEAFFLEHGLKLEQLREDVARYEVAAEADDDTAGAVGTASYARSEALARIRGYLSELVSLTDANQRILQLMSAIHLELESLE